MFVGEFKGARGMLWEGNLLVPVYLHQDAWPIKIPSPLCKSKLYWYKPLEFLKHVSATVYPWDTYPGGFCCIILDQGHQNSHMLTNITIVQILMKQNQSHLTGNCWK